VRRLFWHWSGKGVGTLTASITVWTMPIVRCLTATLAPLAWQSDGAPTLADFAVCEALSRFRWMNRANQHRRRTLSGCGTSSTALLLLWRSVRSKLRPLDNVRGGVSVATDTYLVGAAV
jgi:hypothetical protein